MSAAPVDVDDLAPDLDPPDGGPAPAAGDAPWGRRADGSPRAKPGRPRKRAASSASPPPAGRQQRGPGGRFGKSAPDYRPAVAGLFQSLAQGLFVAGAARRDIALVADSVTITEATPGLAEAGHQIALSEPRIAAYLDRVGQVGPWAILLTGLSTIVFQMLVNHGVMPAGLFGTKSREDLARQAGFTVVRDQVPEDTPPPEAPPFTGV